ncbi:OLC1v1011804C1 [Oldenlandia corymbosa var. corymbosa]|uniref:OLC1v1011804C1 n=1 Tax=Oldenlandia corymbosa var. corymbosa TaxID=529605 RepID=A0AAV1DXV9_OLDCO|nr:OLC1v1011804C1 [Oldenlandia corymbosa var. corymbosa]
MVLGLKATKSRRNPSFHVDYLIHIQEIKPWPPSQSLRTVRAVLIQWEHGDRNSGSTKQVAPSLGSGSGVGDGRIEINDSFRLPVTLAREQLSARGGNGGDTFLKNCIEFSLYEQRRDKTVKGLLGSAVVDLAEYGVLRESISISVPINCKRTYGNASQPVLYLRIQSVGKSRMISSSRDSLMREASMDRNGVDSVSALMSEEYAEEAETASLTDDDISSHSSLVVSSSTLESHGGSPFQNKEKESEEMKTSAEQAEDVCSPVLEKQLLKPDDQFTTSNSSSKGTSSRSSSIDLTSDLAWITKKIGGQGSKFSSSTHEVAEKENSEMRTTFTDGPCDIGENLLNNGSNDTLNRARESSEVLVTSSVSNLNGDDSLGSANLFHAQISGDDEDNAAVPNMKGMHGSDFTRNGSLDGGKYEKYQETGKQREVVDEMGQCTEDDPIYSSFGFDSTTQASLDSDAFLASRNSIAMQSSSQNNDKHSNKQVKSVRSPIESHRSNGLGRANASTSGEVQTPFQGFTSNGKKDNKFHPKETRNLISETQIKQLEQRMKNLETELREAAAIEVGLYAVVAEHGSSANKVHAPARRLSRFYLHARKAKPQSQSASAAKSAISGLVLVAKACGNDVPRLTFWLSNAIVLRAIISESLGEHRSPNGMRNRSKISSPLKWQSLGTKGIKSNLHEIANDWDNPYTFQTALVKVESWIFSRIIESIWWQTLTPCMQSGAANVIHKGPIIGSHKTFQRTSSSFDEELGTFSLELWKEAFRDACERICPVRAEGHECGCLPVLSRLVMEQCVARLDVAMFNAILRESVDDIPTDPVSDPISDAKVLPIPVGKASFGAGAQLKNAIGNWSRWLTDLFGIDDDDVDGTYEHSDDESSGQDSSLKSFNLLNALSDLMMLPKDMLLSRTIRKEVCPTFGTSLIRRVLNSFVPDEFCPEPVPKVVLEALNSEDSNDSGEENSIVDYPCSAAPIVYLPPSAASVNGILGGDAGGSSHYRLTRKGSLLLTESYASDDELDELASPLSSIFADGIQSSSSQAKTITWTPGEGGAVRYQLLREVWKNSNPL